MVFDMIEDWPSYNIKSMKKGKVLPNIKMVEAKMIRRLPGTLNLQIGWIY